MTKLCLLSIWLGKLPETFELWKRSVLNNPTVDVYLITDNTGLQEEANLKVITMSFSEIKKRFQTMLKFPISLDSPYKLCDYRPVWGEAFREITESYEFWGHIDMDIVLGDIRAFLTDDLLAKYDKLFEAGCFILYRNTVEMRELYKRSMEKENMAYPYKKVFQCPYACYFDEYLGMNILGWKYGIRLLRDQDKEEFVQDFGWQNLEFKSYITEDVFVFRWKDGKLYRYLYDASGTILQETQKEYMLVHIQKRKMDIAFSVSALEKEQSVWIVPNRFQPEQPQRILYTEEEKKLYAKQVKKADWKRSLRNMKNYGLLPYIPHFFRSRRIRTWILKEKGFF